MPLRNRKEEEVTQLKGVTLLDAVDPTKIKLGTFQQLSNMTTSGIGSIKRKRGVLPLDGVDSPELTISFQDNFLRDDCDGLFIPASLTDCVDCLTVTETGSVIAKSAEATDPCYCFYGGQLCYNRLVSIQLEFVADLAGDGRSGVVLAVPVDATADNFTGMGLVYTPGTLSLELWDNTSLQTFDVTLDTAAVVLVEGDIIKLTLDTDTQDLIGYVNNVEQVSINVGGAFLGNQGVGLIVVGNTGADDRLEWTNIFAECRSSSPAIACCACDSVIELNIQCCPTVDPPNPDCSVDCDGPEAILKVCGGTAPYTWEVFDGAAEIQEIDGENCVIVTHTPGGTPSTCPAYYKRRLTISSASNGLQCSDVDTRQRKTVLASLDFTVYDCNQQPTTFAGCSTNTCLDFGNNNSFSITSEQCSGVINQTGQTLGSFSSNLILDSATTTIIQTIDYHTCPDQSPVVLTVVDNGSDETDFLPLFDAATIAAMCAEGCDETPVVIRVVDADLNEAFFNA